MRFVSRTAGVIELCADAVANLLRHRQCNASDSESGGVLLGRVLLDGGTIVDAALGPNRADKRSRFYFDRDRRSAQTQVNEIWARSEGTKNYLGEWHTHPEDDPSPSLLDRMEWIRISRSVQSPKGSLIFIIVGRKTINVWESGRDGWWHEKLLHKQ